jgi:4-hydroxybenzoyl-CoA thioesterase
MSRIHTITVSVEFGDCDPAQIVYFPNFFRWMDAASRHYFSSAGVPLWHELEKATGILGTPIVSTDTSFVRPASYGDTIEIDSEVVEWRTKSFVMRHRVRRGTELLVECNEVRVFAKRVDGDPKRIQAAPVPADIRALCEGAASSGTQ